MRNTVLFLVCIVFFSCQHEGHEKIYLGSYRTTDQLIPFPFIIKKNKDSIYLYNEKGSVLGQLRQNEIKEKDTLKFKKNHFKILRKKGEELVVFDLLDTFNFRRYKDKSLVYKYAGVLRELDDSKVNVSYKEIVNQIEKGVWSYQVVKDENDNPNEDFNIKKKLQFRNSKLTELTEYYYQNDLIISENQKLQYHIFRIGQKMFVSFYKSDENPYSIYLVNKLFDGKLELIDFSSRKQKEKLISLKQKSLKIITFEKLLNKSSYFENCFEGYQGEYYFGDRDVTFRKGNEYLVSYVNKEVPEFSEKKDGYIIIHFNINCNKLVGDFGLIQMTKDYKKTKFSKDIVKYLTTKVAKLRDWPDIKKTWLKYKDVHAFLMFKIEEGKITDLCP